MTGPRTPSLCRAFIGRGDELAHLQSVVSSGGAAVVRGGPGLGKTRLLSEATAGVRPHGGHLLTGRSSAGGVDRSFRPIREILLGAARTGVPTGPELTPFLPALGRLVPDWATTTDAADTSPVVVAEGLLRLLTALHHDGRPVVAAVEDLHWADPETLAVVEYLADNLPASGPALVATIRSGQPGDGQQLVDQLLARRQVELIDLSPLDRDEVAEMVEATMGATPLATPVLDALIERSDGVPFLVEELLASSAGAAEAVPTSVSAAVEVRLAGLDPSGVRVLQHASVLGRAFDWHLVGAATGLTDDELVGHLREAALAQLLDVEGTGYRFRHALTRDAVLASMQPGELQLAAGRLLAAADRPHDGAAADPRQQADLAEQAGDLDRAADLRLEAASAAISTGALAEARSLAERAREARPVPADLALLRVLALMGLSDEVGAVGERLLAAGLDSATTTDVQLALADAHLAAGRWDDAQQAADAARRAAPSGTAQAAHASVLDAAVAWGRTDTARAHDLAETALADAEAAGDAELQCQALEVLGRSLRGKDLGAAAQAFRQAHGVAVAHGLAVWRIRATQELGTIDLFDTLATERMEEARAEAVAAGAVGMAAVIDLQLAAFYVERGECEAAMDAAQRSAEAARRYGLATLPMSLFMQATAHAFAGRRAAMDEAAAAAIATGQDEQNVQIGLHASAAVEQIGRSDLTGAARSLDQMMEGLRLHPGAAFPFTGMWPLLHTVLDDGRGGDARAEVRALPIDTPWSRATLAAADAVALGRSGEQDAAATLFAEADAALGRGQGGFRQALVRLLVAPCAHADGWGEPVGWLRAAVARFDALGLEALARATRSALTALGEPAPRLRRTSPAVPDHLAALGITPREHEVLALVADGSTNKEIAETLVLSTRTVEKHVERLLMKAGVASRTDLPDLYLRSGRAEMP